jgi:hypothetical protein
VDAASIPPDSPELCPISPLGDKSARCENPWRSAPP